MTTKKKTASERKAYTAPAIEKSETVRNEHRPALYDVVPVAAPITSLESAAFETQVASVRHVRIARRWSLTPDGAHYQHAVTGETVPALAVVAQGKAGEGIEATCTRLAAEARDAR